MSDSSRYKIKLWMIAITFFVIAGNMSAQHISSKNSKILWVVDGVALNDSVFNYSPEQMKSDSAAVLASRALSWVYPKDIDSISMSDSIEAYKSGFTN